MALFIKRVYDAPSSEDGRRILVDRLWPRGLSREKAKIDQWAKEVAPSAELRRWFDHDPQLWVEFGKRFRSELTSDEARACLDGIREKSKSETVTLVFGAKDELHNNAVVLQQVLTAPEDQA